MSGNTVTDYASLVTAIQDFLTRSDITDANYAPEIIQAAQNNVYYGFMDSKGNFWPGLRVRQMEKSFTGSIASNEVAAPSDYLDMKYLWLNLSAGSIRLERKPTEWIYKNYGPQVTGVPAYFCRDASNFYFGPYSDSGYTYNGVYYAKSTLLSSANTTDWMVTNFPHMLLYGCLAEAAELTQNPVAQPFWQKKFTDAMRTIQLSDDRESRSGSPLAAVPA